MGKVKRLIDINGKDWTCYLEEIALERSGKGRYGRKR